MIAETSNMRTATDLAEWQARIQCELPNSSLYTFEGVVRAGTEISVGPKQLLLRGSTLRNTEWVLTLVIFTGDDTKLMRNSRETPSKRSSLEKATNRQVLILIAVLFLLCLACSITNALKWEMIRDMPDVGAWYLAPHAPDANSAAVSGSLVFFTFIIL